MSHTSAQGGVWNPGLCLAKAAKHERQRESLRKLLRGLVLCA